MHRKASKERAGASTRAGVACDDVRREISNVRTLPGRLLLKGGIQSHPHTVSCDGVHDNPHCLTEKQLLRQLSLIQ